MWGEGEGEGGCTRLGSSSSGGGAGGGVPACYGIYKGPEDTVTTQHTHSLTSAPIVTTCLFVQSTVSAVKSEES
ncbi:hypothetical protein Pcinc_010452 [Petrolisthes cinctipes]|uniref:Uncharacterized protein n=1 Tax=Petrolisthes cinctipes TaxID=88211 RepID=A0AAE1G3B5_PETCI|nr:hypothetical protein Pcinc_010452 [Petrolisthes cinctipes]